MVSFEVGGDVGDGPAAVERAGGIIGCVLRYASVLMLAATVSIAGTRMWREARQRLPAPPSAVAFAPGGGLELSTDRHAVTRVDRDRVVWTVTQPHALDVMEVSGSLVIALAHDRFVVLDFDTGRTRFSWELPANELWAAQRPIMLGECLITMTTHGDDAIVRCLDLAAGAVRWRSSIAGGRSCTQPAVAIHGAYLLQCSGWTIVVDDREGAIQIEAGGIGLIQREPPLLLRSDGTPTLASWSPGERRFTEIAIVRGLGDVAATSAVRHDDQLVLRAPSSSDSLALISRDGETVTIADPRYRLADDAPLVLDCGGTTSPRFQLLELAPRHRATHDPEVADRRVLALLDVEAAALVWTSHAFVPMPRGRPRPRCADGRYVVGLEVQDRAGPFAVVWEIDANTGKTTGVGPSPSITAEIDSQRGSSRRAHAALERVIGPLPSRP